MKRLIEFGVVEEYDIIIKENSILINVPVYVRNYFSCRRISKVTPVLFQHEQIGAPILVLKLSREGRYKLIYKTTYVKGATGITVRAETYARLLRDKYGVEKMKSWHVVVNGIHYIIAATVGNQDIIIDTVESLGYEPSYSPEIKILAIGTGTITDIQSLVPAEPFEKIGEIHRGLLSIAGRKIAEFLMANPKIRYAEYFFEADEPIMFIVLHARSSPDRYKIFTYYSQAGGVYLNFPGKLTRKVIEGVIPRTFAIDLCRENDTVYFRCWLD